MAESVGFEPGQRDADKGVFEQAETDISGNHSDRDTHYKGKRGDQLDGDKKEDK